jgi:cytochrome c biogenesis protein CcmG/thiol:disulfide interchange protein DsbE
MDMDISNIDIVWRPNKFFKKKIMKKKILPLFMVIVFGFIFIVFYKGLEDSNIYTPDTKLKNKVPIFKTKDFYSGVSLNSSDIFKFDKNYLLNIWSSWCVPCRQEHPLLMELSKESKIIIVGMNYKDNKKNAQSFLKELGNPYEMVLVDLDGTIAIDWGAYGVPESYLIYNNKIIKKFIGPLNQQLINEMKLLVK